MSISNRVRFALIFVVINLHVLINLSPVLYLTIYGLAVANLIVDYLSKRRDRRSQVATGLFNIWIVIAIFGFLTSLTLISPMGASLGLVRFLFTAPLFLALVLYTENITELRHHIQTFVGFFALASLTIPLQFFIGPISWFAESSQRNGFERYSSILGNLTAIGITVGSYVVLSRETAPARRWLWLILMILPAIISLDKAAIANIALGLLLLLFLNRRSLSKMAIPIIAVSGLIGWAYAILPVVQQRIASPLLSFGIGTAASAGIAQPDDVTVTTSIWDRLFSLPQANFDALANLHSPLVYLTGGGFGMGNTALVPTADVLAPMAHNQFAESVTVFGILGGGVQIIAILLVAFRLARRTKTTGGSIVTTILFAYVIVLVNSVFANGTLYEPASASIFYLALFASSTKIFKTDPDFTGDNLALGKMASQSP